MDPTGRGADPGSGLSAPGRRTSVGPPWGPPPDWKAAITPQGENWAASVEAGTSSVVAVDDGVAVGSGPGAVGGADGSRTVAGAGGAEGEEGDDGEDGDDDGGAASSPGPRSTVGSEVGVAGVGWRVVGRPG